MNVQKTISRLTILISMIAAFVSIYGIITFDSTNSYTIKTFRGETVELLGAGLYQYDSVSIASQAIAQDFITLLFGIPLLLVSLLLIKKNSFKGRLLLTGTLGYFLYTYTSYTFLAQYNGFFILYVLLMSTSFFAFTLSFMSIKPRELAQICDKAMPTRLIGGFIIGFCVIILFLWMGMIVPPLIEGISPTSLQHYTTLPIQALDLGFIIPIGILSGILFIRKRPLGYLIGTVILIKCFTLSSAVTAMVIMQVLEGVQLQLANIILFPILNLMIIFILYLLFRHIKGDKEACVK
ncbi:hypothetical protein BN1058_00229 [Paraliobacillus sp. PM-2]|uniref:hypothetical protein n=1 Tax=Paraliobacillus sp. PM-2 TaxID=1462524 RepID=UPI00061C61A6|nr:hypothetical protein [Paraliobacillus sp. PM-2]CQR45986.1 hypothetical protein BN1058_00229 [Paraliobacillus sp. PM-2]